MRHLPLHDLVELRNENEAVRVATNLVTNGVDVDAVDESGNTALLLASRQTPPRVRFARLLLHHAVDPFRANARGSTPLHVAAANGQTELVRLFLMRATRDDIEAVTTSAPRTWGHTPLALACRALASDSLALLLAAGANPNCAQDSDGRSALGLVLHCAYDDAALPCFALLLAGGFRPTPHDWQLFRDCSVADRSAWTSLSDDADQISAATRRIRRAKWSCAGALVTACLGLAPLELDANSVCHVIDELHGAMPFAWHELWEIATKVKHFGR